MKKAYVQCLRCSVVDRPRRLDTELGLRVEVGTSTRMRCQDCGDQEGRARLCRGCCPTGHGTHGMAQEG